MLKRRRGAEAPQQHVKHLREAANEAAKLVQKVYFLFLIISLYFAIIIGSTTHEQLLRDSGVALPILNVKLSIYWVYAIVPWLYLAVHLNLLVQHHLLARKIHQYNHYVSDITGRAERHEERLRLYPLIFVQMLAAIEASWFRQWILRTIVFLSLVGVPLFLLMWAQARFLPYHSETVTWGHRIIIMLDLALIWTFIPVMYRGRRWRDAWPSFSEFSQLRQSGRKVVYAAAGSLAIIFFSWMIAVVPGGNIEQVTNTLTSNDYKRDKEFLGIQGDWHTRMRAMFPRFLDVRERKLVQQEPPAELIATFADQSEKLEDNILEHTQGLYLRGRDLRGAFLFRTRLIKADLRGADLRGALLIDSQMKGGNLEKADLSGSYFRWTNVPKPVKQSNFDNKQSIRTIDQAKTVFKGKPKAEPSKQSLRKTLNKRNNDFPKKKEAISSGQRKLSKNDFLLKMDLKGADLSGAVLRGVQLEYVNLEGANLKGTDLEGANLREANLARANLQDTILVRANLQGAKLIGADLRNAKLFRAKLQGANLILAKLQGADLRNAKMHGARLWAAELMGADLSQVKLQGADLRSANLRGANLYRADLRGAKLHSAKLQGAGLDSTKIGGASFLYAYLYLSNLFNINRTPLGQETIDRIKSDLKVNITGDDANLVDSILGRLNQRLDKEDSLKSAKSPSIVFCGKKSPFKHCLSTAQWTTYEDKLIPYLVKQACKDKYVAIGITRRALRTYYKFHFRFIVRKVEFREKLAEALLQKLQKQGCPGVTVMPKNVREELREIIQKKQERQEI